MKAKLKLNGLIPQHVARIHEAADIPDHKEPKQPPFPGADAHKVLREKLKKVGTEKGVDAAVDYVIEQFPQYEKYRKELTKYLTMDNIDKKVKFEE